MFSFIMARLKEASTWRGLIGLAMAVGLQVTPDQATSVISVGMAVAGAIGVFTPDSTPTQGTAAAP